MRVGLGVVRWGWVWQDGVGVARWGGCGMMGWAWQDEGGRSQVGVGVARGGWRCSLTLTDRSHLYIVGTVGPIFGQGIVLSYCPQFKNQYHIA